VKVNSRKEIIRPLLIYREGCPARFEKRLNRRAANPAFGAGDQGCSFHELLRIVSDLQAREV
jgi:hypothetical protein